jgi:phosphomannomutase
MSVDPELRAIVQAWIAKDPDPGTRAELEALLASRDAVALGERFSGRLEFGTAGLRATMQAGPMGMNRVVVRESAAGIARYLLANVPGAAQRGVVVAHDARHRSDRFARDCAEVIAAHGIRVVLAEPPQPTPVGVYAVRPLDAAAGIVITASHNPPADNGLKLFMGDAAQIVPPVDSHVADQIAAVAADGIVTPAEVAPAAVAPLPDAIVEAYRIATLGRVPPPAAPIRIATTAMHGVGGALLSELLAAAGHADVHPVPEQLAPDPDFPTVGFPNPEEPGATDLLAARMQAVAADVGLALDPDADRVAVLTYERAGSPRQLTGDEVGALLGEWLLAHVTDGPGRLVATTVVSSSLLARIAEHHGVRHEETLTGFKWLSRPAFAHPELRQVLAYEEAIGYAIGADVHDKDGLSGALAVASMVAWENAHRRTLLDALDALHTRHGAHITENFSLRYEGPGWRDRRDDTVAALAASPPTHIGDDPVEAIRWLAPDVLRVDLGGGLRVLVRPSGTEPKLKCYLEVVVPVASSRDLAGARAKATKVLEALKSDLASAAGL